MSFLIVVLSILTAGCATTGSGGGGRHYMPPSLVAEHSTAVTQYWTAEISIQEGARSEGLWEIRYELEVPEVQLQEIPIYLPFPGKSTSPQSNSLLGGLVTVESSGGSQQMEYWMVHMYTLRWMYPQAKIIAYLKNTSDKTVDTSNMRIEAESVAGVTLKAGSIGSWVGPHDTVRVELFDVNFNELSQELTGSMPVKFRFVDMPVDLNPNGSIRETYLYQESFQLTRTPHTYSSDITLTAVHVAKAHFKQDAVAHYRTDISRNAHFTTEYFEPAPLHFKIDLSGPPLVSNEPALWDEDKVPNALPYDFGRPERVFADGMPAEVEAWSETL
ncbi:MAG: hypothetical protein ACLFPO_06840 [Spirochaetaceae bacterium]